MTDDQLSALIKAETELMLQRCVAAGADYDKAFWELNFQTTMHGMAITSARDKAKESPFTEHLQRAYDCQFAGDKAGHRAACLAWLEAKHGVRLGDTALVYGWSVPREILLDDFVIDFKKDESLSHGFMWFTGPTSHAPKGKPPEYQGQSMDYAVHKTQPSAKLRAMFPQRF
jgi:hypothetical protein